MTELVTFLAGTVIPWVVFAFLRVYDQIRIEKLTRDRDSARHSAAFLRSELDVLGACYNNPRHIA